MTTPTPKPFDGVKLDRLLQTAVVVDEHLDNLDEETEKLYMPHRNILSRLIETELDKGPLGPKKE